jgi:DnaK suppressor protein
MDPGDTYRAVLRERRANLHRDVLAALQRVDANRYATLEEQVHDTKDQAISQLLAQSEDAELKRSAAELQDIDAALQRVDAGTYGRCTDCGIDIPPARLDAYSTAKRCLPCQMRYESRR